MSSNDDDKPTTSADAAGSVFKRLQHPVSTGGEERERGRTASAREIEGEVLQRGNQAPDVPPAARPRRRVGRRPPTEEGQRAIDAALGRPTDDEGSHMVPPTVVGEDYDESFLDEAEARRSERQVSLLFILAMLASLGFIAAYVLIDQNDRYGQYMNWALGGLLTVSLLGIGAGMILWAKRLMPHDKAIQEREPFHSPEEEELLTEETFFRGAAQSQIGTRKLMRRTLIGAMGLFPLPLLVLLRDLGPLPHSTLRHTSWKKDKRLVDVETKLPVKRGDIAFGGVVTVMPEGFESAEKDPLSPTILIRFRPNEIRSKKEAEWGADDHVAYSKICSHAGCPISLYEQQTHNLLCPCHQSTFDMANDAKVIFGPAARALPQLPIYVDDEGYFRARRDYTQPVGPSFWERG